MISFANLGQHGRLGNQLFQYAFLRTTARRLGVKFWCPAWAGDRIFLLDDAHERAVEREPAAAVYRQPAENCGFVESALSIRDGTDVIGYFQAERYFDRDSVLSWYTFRPEVVDEVERRYGHVDPAQCTAIHLRFGDMRYNSQFVVLPPRYYAKALGLVPPRSRILVFSDEPAAARGHLRGLPGRFLYVEGNGDFEDLYLMTRCRDVICSTSTFSWWGAWLNRHADKVVVAPPDGLRPGHPTRCPDFCCTGWIALDTMRPVLDHYRFVSWKRGWAQRLTRVAGFAAR